MKLPNLGLVILTGIALVGAIALAFTTHPVPAFLSTVAVAGFGAVAGVSIPALASSTTTVTSSSGSAPGAPSMPPAVVEPPVAPSTATAAPAAPLAATTVHTGP